MIYEHHYVSFSVKERHIANGRTTCRDEGEDGEESSPYSRVDGENHEFLYDRARPVNGELINMRLPHHSQSITAL
jgi:hypothetical protein